MVFVMLKTIFALFLSVISVGLFGVLIFAIALLKGLIDVYIRGKNSILLEKLELI